MPINYTTQMIFYFSIKFVEVQSTILDKNANAVFWSCIVFGNLLDQVYKFIDMPYYKFIESLQI